MIFDNTQSAEEDEDFMAFLRHQDKEFDFKSTKLEETTSVLDGAEYVFHNAIDVSLNLQGVKMTASMLYNKMTGEKYSTKNWSLHELHPKAKDETTVDFIFTMDLLNFSFWSENTSEERFSIKYKDQNWTGYWSLVAALQRALEESQINTVKKEVPRLILTYKIDIPITSPKFWVNEDECTDKILKYVFRSATPEEIPLFQERINILRQAGKILTEVRNN